MDGKGHAFWGAHHHSWTVAHWHHVSYMLCHLEDLRKGLQWGMFGILDQGCLGLHLG
jgi:hypothetical protein